MGHRTPSISLRTKKFKNLKKNRTYIFLQNVFINITLM